MLFLGDPDRSHRQVLQEAGLLSRESAYEAVHACGVKLAIGGGR